jgi:RNA polymerase primary sigma factor
MTIEPDNQRMRTVRPPRGDEDMATTGLRGGNRVKGSTGKQAVRPEPAAATVRGACDASRKKATRGRVRSTAKHQMVAQSTVGAEPRRDALDLAAQARARVWMQREIAFIDNPAFRTRDAESLEEVLEYVRSLDQKALQGDLPEKLPAHLRRLCEVPLLSVEEERQLFRRMNYLKYRANQLRVRLREDSVRREDLDAIESLLQAADHLRNRIVRANMRLVMSIVKHYITDSMAFDDLLSEGATALLRATEKFDFSRGFRFSTYVTKVVRREVFRLVMAAKRQGDRFATGSWEFLGEQSREIGDEVDNEVDLAAMRGDLHEFFARLDPREQMVLNARFGMDGADHAPSLNELGQRMGVSKERVRQLEMRALKKLSKHFETRRAERRVVAIANQ